MLCIMGPQGVGKSTLFRLLALQDEWFPDDLRRIEDDNVFRELQGHWIIEMAELLATFNVKIVEEIKSFISRQKDTYKVPYELHPADRPRQCVFIGTSNSMSFLSLQLSDHAYTIVSTGTGNVVMTKEQRIKFEKRRFIMFVHIRNDGTLRAINPPDETKQEALRFWNTLTPDKKRLSTQTEDQLIDKLYDYYGGGYKKRCNL